MQVVLAGAMEPVLAMDLMKNFPKAMSYQIGISSTNLIRIMGANSSCKKVVHA
jgi:hypothetical protein